ncbi:MAG: MarR family transcriptional regulator [Candidatus Gastranaerophilales bacterium]|nr:MarR family transcriptional regulator [Candidatus Gastranaerophilales bacterium]
MFNAPVIKNIDNLNNNCQEKIKTLTRSHINASELLKLLYSYPRITAKDICESLKMDYQNVNNLLKAFVKLGIIEANNKKRNKTYTFKEYLNIFN